jgi:hypothetical protein
MKARPTLSLSTFILCWSAMVAGAAELEAIPPAASLGPKTEPVNAAGYRVVLHVSAGAKDAASADGSRERPFATPAQSLASIHDARADRKYAILVGEGHYDVVDLAMKKYVDLFGGFDAKWDRDIVAHATTLDANHAGRVLRGCDHATLDGFVITGGRCQGPGGAILCDGFSPALSNNVIHDNQTVAPDNFRADLIHQRGTDGGAIALLSGSTATLRNNLIHHNATGVGNGGGVWVWNHCKPTLAGNVILANRTGVSGKSGKDGSRSSNGGGVAVSLDCRPDIAGNLIANNSTGDNSDGGGVYLEYDASAHVAGNWIVANFAMDDGGGMYVMKASEPLVERNLIAANRTTNDGSSGIRLSKEGRMRAAHNLFVANRGGLDAVNSWLVLTNNTFVDCTRTALACENKLDHLAPGHVEGNLFAGEMQSVLREHRNPSRRPFAEFHHNAASCDGLPGADDRTNVRPKFLDDGARGSATVRPGSFDPLRQTTRVEVSGVDPLAAADLTGRLVRIGDEWRVIQSADAHGVTVWGQVAETSGAPFTLAPTYRPASGDVEVANDVGAYAK